MTEHLDDLPHGWAQPSVGEVGSIRLGRQRSPDKQSGLFPTKYLRTANITSDGLDLTDVREMDFSPIERVLYALQSDDIVLADSSGSPAQVGRAAIWNGEITDCCYQNHIIRFRPNAVLAGYALIVFRHFAVSGVFARIARGIGILHLGAARFAELPFPLPPWQEQQRIVNAWGTRRAELRATEAALRSALSSISEQNREILEAAVTGELVEPEAICAKREARPYEHARELLARTTQVESLPSEENLASHAHLPLGWSWAHVEQVGEVTLGKAREPKSHHGPNMRPYLRVANVYEDRIDTSDILEMSFTAREVKVYALQHGDILLNEGQSPELVGRPAMYRDEVSGACFQNTLLRFRAGPAISPDYALIVFRHYLHSGEFKKVARWSTNIAHLGRNRFAAMRLPIPPLAEQKRIIAETRRRLEASSIEEAAVRASLDRLPAVEAELLFAAVSGSLVPQIYDEEPADVLLKRLGPPPINAIGNYALIADPGEEAATMVLPFGENKAAVAPSLAEVLLKAGAPLSLPDLFLRAGYDRDATEHVEQFYLALRTEIGRTIRMVGDSQENVLLEAILDAPQ